MEKEKDEAIFGVVDGDIYDYDAIAEKFNQDLVKKLRQHGTPIAFLELWVPEADPLLGISGMVDAARLAGRKELKIIFSSSTVPADLTQNLRTSLMKFCKVSMEPFGVGKILLSASDISDARAKASEKTSNVKRNFKPEWSVDQLVQEDIETSLSWKANENEDFGDITPSLRQQMRGAVTEFLHKGNLDSNLYKIQATENKRHIFSSEIDGDSLELCIDVSSTKVVAAGHYCGKGAATDVALELFCRMAIGKPLQEVADHLGLRVLAKISRAAGDRSVNGVLLPRNAGQPFCLGPMLARSIFEQYIEFSNERVKINYYQSEVSERWLSMGNEERERGVREELAKFVTSHGLNQGDIILDGIEKNKSGADVRGVLSFSKDVQTSKKPSLMRQFEDTAREVFNVELDFVADRLVDTSPLRRLSDTTPQKSRTKK